MHHCRLVPANSAGEVLSGPSTAVRRELPPTARRVEAEEHGDHRTLLACFDHGEERRSHLSVKGSRGHLTLATQPFFSHRNYLLLGCSLSCFITTSPPHSYCQSVDFFSFHVSFYGRPFHNVFTISISFLLSVTLTMTLTVTSFTLLSTHYCTCQHFQLVSLR